MNYQFVLQFPSDAPEDLETIIELEEQITSVLDDQHDVDGYDIGSGEMNIFIFTSDPHKALSASLKTISADLKAGLKAAYREVDGEEYTVIYPPNSDEPFNII